MTDESSFVLPENNAMMFAENESVVHRFGYVLLLPGAVIVYFAH